MRNGSDKAPPAIDGYRYLELLGHGGFADVFCYEQEATGAFVAIKVLRRDPAAETGRARLSREALAMGKLARASGQHPHVAAVQTAGATADGRPYLVMEYCPGGSLAARLDTSGPLRPADLLRIGVQVSGAVHMAHLAGVTHRDIKPGNILLAGDGTAKLADFGIAALTEDESADSSGWLSPHYAAPELVANGVADRMTDVYALAATMYELAAGRPPFKVPNGDNSRPAIERRVIHDPVPRLPRDDLPESLDWLLRTAMTKDPTERRKWVDSAMEFAERLQGIQQELHYSLTKVAVYGPVPARPDPSPSPSDTGPGRGTGHRVALSPPDPPLADTALRGEAFAEATGPVEVTASARATPAWRERIGSRTAVIAVSLVILALVVAGVAALSAQRPAKTSVGAVDPGPVAVGQPPVPVPTVVAKRRRDGSVTFTWTYESPAAGDVFRVTPNVDGADQATAETGERTWTVKAKATQRVCLDVSVQRADHHLSNEPGHACAA